MTELSRREFRRVYRRINGAEPITFDRMLAVIACSGKALQINEVEKMWPGNEDSITIDQAYSLYIRYDVPPLPVDLSSEESEYFRGCKAQHLIDCITSTYPELQEAVQHEMKQFTLKNGDIDVNELFKQMEITRKEALLTLTSPSISSQHSSPNVKKQEYEPVEKSTGFRGMLIISPPLITTTYTIKVPEKCRATITLQLTQNSNSTIPRNGEHLFANDVFLLVQSKEGKFLGVTKNITDEGFTTDELTLENDTTMVVMSLGTTSPSRASSPETELIFKDGKVTKQFKVTLMNIFDMFDLDGDGLLDQNEYNYYAMASGDSPASDGDWKKMKEIVEFRDERLTLRGFLDFHQIEISRGEAAALEDCWASLIQIGFNHQLKMVNSTPFLIDIKCDSSPLILPKLVRVNKEMRDNMISQFYTLGTIDKSCELEPRTFSTNYFGLTIVDRIRALDNAGYRIEVDEEENIKWHYISGQTNIRPFTYESELVLICTWVARSKNFKVKYRIVREEEPKRMKKTSKATIGE